jgi:phospholipid transport system substrate-binding protein
MKTILVSPTSHMDHPAPQAALSAGPSRWARALHALRIGTLLLGVLLLGTLFLSASARPAAAQSSSGASSSGASQDAQQEIRTMLERRDQQIKDMLAGADGDYTTAQREELKTLINGVVDFRAMAQSALGPFWEDRTEEEKAEFVEVFRDIVRSQSLSDLDVYNSTVDFETIDVVGDSAFVRTMTTYEGTRVPVEYALERADSTWKAEDIIVDGVSTAEGYARSFQTVVRRRGFDALLQSLKRKQASIASRENNS